MDGAGEGMSQMEEASNVGGREHHDKGLFRTNPAEEAMVLPPVIPPMLHHARLISSGHWL